MKIFAITFFLLLCFTASLVWAEPFMDDFNREDDDELDNDWMTQTDGTITVEIVDEEVLISGAQGIDWQRSGLSRTIEDETKVYFDFLANESFNVHIRIDDAITQAYIDIYAPPGGSFSYASSEDGGWPGWTATAGPSMVPGQYNTAGIEQDGTDFAFYLNDKEVVVIENNNLTSIGEVLIASDAAAGTAGSLHIDNVIIGDVEGGTPPKAVAPSGNILTIWGRLKQL